GHTDHVSSFSSIGSQVSVAAPGGYGSYFDANDIYSTMPNYYVTLNGYGISQNYGYCYGTSMASPMVAGAAALILAVNSSLLPSEVRGILEETAEQVGGYYYSPTTGKSNELGHGRINAYEAVLLAGQSAYVAGDASGDGVVDVADVVFLINYLYRSGAAPDPLAAGDPSDDCVVDVADIVYLINYLYRSGPAPNPGCA
ncbi:MAG: S8 family serine peptidase, partial [Candidatus Zixiibacteriota bacterium]